LSCLARLPEQRVDELLKQGMFGVGYG
jgi:hypothetical protein